jgi:hypothetical protein
LTLFLIATDNLFFTKVYLTITAFIFASNFVIMKELFPGYSKKSDKEIRSFWDQGIIVFDANVLLNLYRYSEATRNTLLDLIGKLKDKIWLPHQAALEYNRNRYEVIADQEKAYKEFIDKISQIQKDLQSANKPPFLSDEVHKDLNKAFEKVNDEVAKSIQKYNDYLKEDPVYDTISTLFDEKIGTPFLPEQLKELYKQGEERFKTKTPPGYEDEKTKEGDRKYGDWILWKQMIEKAKEIKRPVIFVTDERKNDWWWKIRDGRNMGPRQELVGELKHETGMEFHMYSSERFLDYGQQYLREKVNKQALEELKQLKGVEMEEAFANPAFTSPIHINGDSLSRLRSIYTRIEILRSEIDKVQTERDSLRDEALENPEAAEYLHSLSMRFQELKMELKHLTAAHIELTNGLFSSSQPVAKKHTKSSGFWGNKKSKKYWFDDRLRREDGPNESF